MLLPLAAGILAHAAEPLPGPAPDPDRRLSEYVHDYWNSDDGLPQNTVMAITQDPQGYLWIGTFEGLARYDGHRFERFQPAAAPALHRATSDLLIDRDGTRWVGTQQAGLFRIDPAGAIRRFTTDDGLAGDDVLDIYRDLAGRLWVATGRGVCELADDRFRCPGPEAGFPEGPVTDLVNTPDGALWLATEAAGLFRVRDGRVDNWRSLGGVDITRLEDLGVDPDGRLWAASFGTGVVRFDGSEARVWGERDGLGNEFILRLTVDAAGSVWVGTYGEGIQRIRDGVVDRLQTSPGLPNSHVQSFFVDREGSLWFGTSGGLNRLRAGPFITVSMPEGLSGPFVRAIAQDRRGAVWVGTDSKGLNVLRDRRLVDRMWDPDLLSNSVRSLWPTPDGGMWIGSYGGGVTLVEPTGALRHFTVADGLASPLVRAVFRDSQGRLWVGADRDGVTRIMPDGQVDTLFFHPERRENDVRAIVEAPDGSLWFGTYGHGVQRLAEEAFAPLPGLDDGVIFAMTFEDDGTVWIGAEAGLHHYDPPSATLRPVFLEGAVFNALPDDRGHLWLCTNRGIIRLRRDALRVGADPEARRFGDPHHGLRSRQCNGATQPAGWQTDDGALWFPMAEGVARVDPSAVVDEPVPPPVTLEAVHLDDERRRPRDGELVVPAGVRRIQFDYVALTFVAPGLTRYRYRLAGYDDGWIEAGPRRSAFYNDLPPGQYRFEVLAANAAGVWNEVAASVRLVQRPRVHQTGWFRILAVALALASVVAISRWRGRLLRRRNQELEAKVADRTRALTASNEELERTVVQLRSTESELVEAKKLAALAGLVAGVAHEVNTPVGNSLTLVSHLKRKAEGLREEGDAATLRQQLGRIVDGMGLVQRDMERAADIIRNFKRVDVQRGRSARRRFRIAETLEAVRLALAEKIAAAGHRLVLEAPREPPLDSYPDAIFEILTLMINNSLEHAFRAPGGTIRVRVEATAEQLLIHYADDGVGIDRELRAHLFEPFFTSSRGTHTGLGMHIVHNLVRGLLGGTIVCLDGPGAAFRIAIPMRAPGELQGREAAVV